MARLMRRGRKKFNISFRDLTERRVSQISKVSFDGEFNSIVALPLRFLCSKGFRLCPCESRLSQTASMRQRRRISFKVFITAEGTKSTITNYDRAHPRA
jgi:hypothetical protein